MITVRFPSGFSVQYNSMNWAQTQSNGTIFLQENSKSVGWHVCVPAGAMIEFVAPCRTYNAANEKQLERLESEVSSLKRTVSRKLKAKA